VDGWLTPDEGQALMNLAHGAVVLELGAYRGRSTIALASVAKRVVSVDWHRGDPAVGNSDTLGRFMANVEAAGMRDKVVPVVGEALDRAGRPRRPAGRVDRLARLELSAGPGGRRRVLPDPGRLPRRAGLGPGVTK
jgi:hypothetical protein